MRRSDLERAARRLAQALGEEDCLLVGGLAVAVHGFVRGTEDVDFAVRRPLRQVQSELQSQGIECSLTRGDILDGDFRCLKGRLAGVPFDVLPPLVPLDWESGIEILLGKRGRVRVVDLGGLVHLKLRAGGPKDLMDVATLVLLHPDRLARARELAVAYGLKDRLEHWLNDPRLKADARGTRPPRSRRRRRSGG